MRRACRDCRGTGGGGQAAENGGSKVCGGCCEPLEVVQGSLAMRGEVPAAHCKG